MRLRRFLILVTLVGVVSSGAVVPATAQAQGARQWLAFAQSSIHPGVQVVTAGAQCTANFVFTDPAGDVYLGQAAHCSSDDGQSSTNGCNSAVLDIGLPVEIDGASRPGTLVYSSWNTMQQVGEQDPNACAHNDFALIRVHPADWPVVNPSMPFFGGPSGLVGTTAPGDTVHTFGNSGLRPDGGAAKTGQSSGQTGDGWNHDVRTTTNPGIPGDSGSGFINAQGQAFGVLSTFEAFPNVGSNGVTDLSRSLAYMAEHTGLQVSLSTGTVAFSTRGGGADSAARLAPEPEVRRLAGAAGTSRVETAVAIGRDDFPAERARTVVLGRADVAADALAGAALAVKLGGPLLLTQSATLHPAVVDEMLRVLRVGDTVHVLGGTAAISTAVTDRLERMGVTVVRLEGPTRVETSIAVARATQADPAAILIADGRSFAEALVAGPAAAALDGVVVLTDGPSSHPSVDSYLAEHTAARVIAIGDAASAAYPAVESLTAAGESALSVKVAETLLPDAVSFGVARRDVFADALAGAAHMGRAGGAVLLTDSTQLSGDVSSYISGRAELVRQAVLYGGASALSSGVRDGIVAALR